MLKILKTLVITGAFLPFCVWARSSDIWSDMGKMTMTEVQDPQVIFSQVLTADGAPDWAQDIRRFFADHGASVDPSSAEFSAMASSTTLFTDPLERFSEMKFWRVVLQQLSNKLILY